MRRFLCTVGAIAVLGATPALAVDFDAWDADDDSFVDRAEFEAGYGEAGLFDEFDMDADVGLNAEEIAGVRYATMDLDGDGAVAVSEWDTWIDRRAGEAEVNLSVSDWDENGDNVISRAEYDEEVARRGMFAEINAGDDEIFDEEEFGTALFDDLDMDNDDRLGEDEFLIDNFGI